MKVRYCCTPYIANDNMVVLHNIENHVTDRGRELSWLGGRPAMYQMACIKIAQ